MHHRTCGISSLLHSVNLILFTLLDPGSPIILRVSPYHSHHISPYITPTVFHSRLKTHLFHKSFPPYKSIVILIPPGLPSRILNLHWIGRALAFVCFSFIFHFFLARVVLVLITQLYHVKIFSRIVSAVGLVLLKITYCLRELFLLCSRSWIHRLLRKNAISKYIANQMSTNKWINIFYRAMHFSANCGIAIACRLSVRLCLSVCVWRW